VSTVSSVHDSQKAVNFMSKCVGLMFVLGLAASVAAETPTVTDYAEVSQRDQWLRHPVYGDASFDTFTHAASNPVCRGKAPFEWPVNGFLFEDPVSGDWFLYIGHYGAGYQRHDKHPSHATVFRSGDQGRHWKDLGRIFPVEEHIFDGEVSPVWGAPDVAVTYADGRLLLRRIPDAILAVRFRRSKRQETSKKRVAFAGLGKTVGQAVEQAREAVGAGSVREDRQKMNPREVQRRR